MKVDFYQLSRDPVDRVCVMLARKVMETGGRLMIVSQDPEQLSLISRSLWRAGEEEFLANGLAGDAGEALQPILLSPSMTAGNGADMVILADGNWREEALEFSRTFLLFDDGTVDGARSIWRALDARDDLERAFYRQDGGRWIKAA